MKVICYTVINYFLKKVEHKIATKAAGTINPTPRIEDKIKSSVAHELVDPHEFALARIETRTNHTIIPITKPFPLNLSIWLMFHYLHNELVLLT